ncbi:MAG: hypothetical protein HYV09_34730 [Deltaproteobacteria bacterium]|nr:hypothetical protein [Deltaproteobacteria bacterium]
MAIPAVTPEVPPGPQAMESTTVRCMRHGHREFVLRWDERRTTAADVRRIVEAIEGDVARGVRFTPGAVVRVGWLPLRVVQTPSRAFTLVEPDLSTLPPRWVRGVDTAIAHLRGQVDLAARVGLADLLTHPSPEQTARVCSHAGGQGLVLDRRAPVGVDSGWFVGCGCEPGDDARLTTLHQLVAQFPWIVDALALPEGCTVACTEAGDALVWRDGEPLGGRAGVSIATRLARAPRPPLARCVGE